MTELTADRPGLERDFALVAGGFAVSLGAIALGLATVCGTTMAARWAGPTTAIVVVELWYIYRHLESNHPEGASRRVYESFGLANSLTVVRGGLFAATGGFVLLAPTNWVAWVPAICYGAGSALDWVDGALARASDRSTVLGERLDQAFDSLGFVVAPVVAVVWGRLPVWYLSLSAARYLFLAGRAWRRRRGRPIHELPASRVRRPLAGLQMAFITLALAPLLAVETVHTLAIVALPPTLLVFARDYLVVAGHLGGQNND